MCISKLKKKKKKEKKRKEEPYLSISPYILTWITACKGRHQLTKGKKIQQGHN